MLRIGVAYEATEMLYLPSTIWQRWEESDFLAADFGDQLRTMRISTE